MSSTQTMSVAHTYISSELDAFLGVGAGTAVQLLEAHLASGSALETPSGDLKHLSERSFALPDNVLSAVQSGVKFVHAYSHADFLMYVAGVIRLIIAENEKQRRLFLYVNGTASFAEGTAVGNYLELMATDGKLSDGVARPTILISDGSGLSGMGGNMVIGNSLASELMKRPNFMQQIVFFRDENAARDAMLKMIFNLLKMKLRTVAGLDNAVAEAKSLGF
jgi:hypothetical protein